MKKRLMFLVMCLVLVLSSMSVCAVKFSGEAPEEADMSRAYVCGEHTMVLLRDTAEKLGYTVIWNGGEMSVSVEDDNVKIKVYIGKDSYFVEATEGVGMTVPAAVGAAPELKEGKTYVPAVMFTMLKHYGSMKQ